MRKKKYYPVCREPPCFSCGECQINKLRVCRKDIKLWEEEIMMMKKLTRYSKLRVSGQL